MDKMTSSVTDYGLLLHQTPIEGVDYFDIGKALAEFIASQKDEKWLTLKVVEYFSQTLDELKQYHSEYGNFKAISNIGILFEPTLKVDLAKLLKDFSTNTKLLMCYKGLIVDEYLYFMTKESGQSFDLKELDYTIL